MMRTLFELSHTPIAAHARSRLTLGLRYGRWLAIALLIWALLMGAFDYFLF